MSATPDPVPPGARFMLNLSLQSAARSLARATTLPQRELFRQALARSEADPGHAPDAAREIRDALTANPQTSHALDQLIAAALAYGFLPPPRPTTPQENR